MPTLSDIATWKTRARRRQFRSEFVKKLIPQTHWGDVLISTVRFVARHRRFPTKRNLWNNHIHRYKASGALRSALCERVSDKEHVKHFVNETIGAGHTIPTLGIIHRPEDLATYAFPDTCCIKPTHSSGRVMFRRDGEGLDYETLVRWFYQNHYLRGREANYRNLVPKLIVEPILYVDQPLTEYRFYCIKGVVRGIWVETGRFTGTRSALYDFDFKPVYRWKGDASRDDPRPDTLDDMLAAATALSADFGLVRVDMISDGQTFCVGELTNCDGNALATFPAPSLHGEALAAHFVFGGAPDGILAKQP